MCLHDTQFICAGVWHLVLIRLMIPFSVPVGRRQSSSWCGVWGPAGHWQHGSLGLETALMWEGRVWDLLTVPLKLAQFSSFVQTGGLLPIYIDVNFCRFSRGCRS